MVERWKEHLFENICGREKILADWLTCWFAHLIQKPYEKPLVALVLRGGKAETRCHHCKADTPLPLVIA